MKNRKAAKKPKPTPHYLDALERRADDLAELLFNCRTRILMAGARPGDYPDAWARRRAT